jgi:hypothetical protein
MDTNGIVYATFRVMLRSVIAQYSKLTNGVVDKDFLEKNVSAFANTNFNNAMLSFGEALHCDGDAKDIKRSVNHLRREYNNVRKYYNNNMFIDSGGYQVQMNFIDHTVVPYLIDGYCETIQNMKEKNVFYFIEDIIATSYNKEKIPSMNIAKKLTIDGIKKMSELPEEKRKNIYFIYHFQSRDVFRAWQDVLHKAHPNEYLESHRWSVGGIVADSGVPKDTNYITYMYPMIDILQQELSYLKKGGTVNLHILGVTAFLDIFFFGVLKRLFDIYDYKINITFDSTQPIIGICRGQKFLNYNKEKDYFFEAITNPNAAKTRLRNSDLHNYGTYENFILNEIEKLKNEYNFIGVPSGHYIDRSDKKPRIDTLANYMFTIKQMLMLKFLHQWSYEKAGEMFQLYFTDYNEFYNYTMECCTKIRGNNMATQTKTKVKNIVNTINLFNDILSGKTYSIDFIEKLIVNTLDRIDSASYNNEDIIQW